MKRTFDLVVSSALLLALSPLLAAIALLVKLDSHGPALFRQERVGLNGRRFTILKFRTMEHSPETGVNSALVTVDGDRRITAVGRVLRSSKLDELPQLVNVVVGDMSLVGPRPEVPRYVDEWTEEQRRLVLSVRPGITDPASVTFRRESELLAEKPDPENYYRKYILPRKVDAYATYVRSRTFVGDLKILLTTIRSVISR